MGDLARPGHPAMREGGGPSLSVAFSGPGAGHRTAVGVLSCVMVGVGVAALPRAGLQLPESSGFMPGFGALTFLADLLTAAVLMRQAVSAQDRALSRLGAAYLFSALAIAMHVLAYPGAFAAHSVIGNSASASWLWCLWHGGFAVLVGWFGLTSPSSRGDARPVRNGPLVAGVVLAVGAGTLLCTAGQHYLPTILAGGRYGSLNTLGIGPAIGVMTFGALLLVTFRKGGRSVLDLWLRVAMLAAAIDVVLTLWSEGRFTLGWYVSRCLSIVTSTVVLVALLSELLRLFDDISAANRELEVLALTDPLTRIANRRAFDSALANACRRSDRERSPLAVLAMDIDFFKTFNDSYGHLAGDDCLRNIAAAIGGMSSRVGDMLARLGGEEFAMLLPGCDEAGALEMAQVMHAAVAALEIPHVTNPAGHVTVSIGVAANPPFPPGVGGIGLAAAADGALYLAKQAGRNRICLADPQMPLPGGAFVRRGA